MSSSRIFDAGHGRQEDPEKGVEPVFSRLLGRTSIDAFLSYSTAVHILCFLPLQSNVLRPRFLCRKLYSSYPRIRQQLLESLYCLSFRIIIICQLVITSNGHIPCRRRHWSERLFWLGWGGVDRSCYAANDYEDDGSFFSRLAFEFLGNMKTANK